VGAVHAFLGHKGKRHDVDGHEHKRHAGARDHPHKHKRPETGVQIKFGKLEHANGKNRQPYDHQPARVALYQHPPDERQHHQRDNGAGRKHQPAELRGVAAERLQHDGQHDGGAVQDNSKRKHEERSSGVVAIFEEMQLDDGILLAKLPKDCADQADSRKHGAPDDEVRFKPVVALPFIENDLEEAEADAEESQADVVNLDAQAIAFPGDMRRIGDERGGHKDGEDSDGNVDEEDPAPGVVVCDPAAQSGSDDGRSDDAHAIDGHGHALLFARKALDEDGLGDGLQAAAARSLQDAEEHQQGQAGGKAAEQRADDENEHTTHVEAFAAKEPREPSSQRKNDGVGNQVGGEHPGALVNAGGEAAGDVRKSDVGDA